MRDGGSVRSCWIALLALGCACGPSSPAAVAPDPSPPRQPPSTPAKPAELAYELPSFTPPPLAAPLRCVAGPADTRKPKYYDYLGDDIYPLTGGPRIRDAGAPQLRRTSHRVRAAIEARAAFLNQCFRWIRFGGAAVVDRDHDIQVRLTVDPVGTVTIAEVVPVDPAQGGDRLARCVAGGLGGLRVRGVTARITDVTGIIRFVRSTRIGRPKRRPPAPAPLRAAGKAHACTGLPAELPTDTLELPVLARIDDWDAAQAALEAAAREREARRQGRRIAHAVVDCFGSNSDWPKPLGRAIIRSNEGAYRDCYRAALGRTPGFAGDLKMSMMFVHGRLAGPAKLSALGDAEFQQCMQDAILDLQAYPVDTGEPPIGIGYELRFRPLPPAATAPTSPLARGEAALALGDGAGAATAFAEAIRASRGGPDECEGRVGVLRALRRETALPIDPRVAAAAADVARYAASPAAADARPACLKLAAEQTAQVALWPLDDTRRWHHPGSAGLHEVSAGIEALLSAWPRHPRREALTEVLTALRDVPSDEFAVRPDWQCGQPGRRPLE